MQATEYTLFDKRVKVFTPKKIHGLVEIMTLSEMQGIKEAEKRIIQFSNTLIFKQMDSEFQQNQLTVLCEFEFPNYRSAKAEILYRAFIQAYVNYFEEIQKNQHLKDLGVLTHLKPDLFEIRKQALQNIIDSWNQ